MIQKKSQLETFNLHVIYMSFTCYLHVMRNYGFSYLHVIYMSFTCYLQSDFTSVIEKGLLLYRWVPDISRTSVALVPDSSSTSAIQH
jgi:hypothetical protein